MSNQNFYVAARPFLFFATGSLTLLMNLSHAGAQSEGFSIFDAPAKELVEHAVESVAPTVSPQEAFTNPVAQLPKTQFGSFADSSRANVPTLQGAKAIGTYARGSAGLGESANRLTTTSSPLSPFTANTLRPSESQQTLTTASVASVPATPVGSEQFPATARPLSAAPMGAAAAQASSEAPRVAQVAFQEGGFNPRSGQGSASTNRFQTGNAPTQPTPNRFNIGNTSPAPSNPASSPANAFSQQRSNSFQDASSRPEQPQVEQGFSAQGSRRSFSQQRTNNGARSDAPKVAAQGQRRDDPRAGQSRGVQSDFASSRGQSGRNSQIQNPKQASRNPRDVRQPRQNERQASNEGSQNTRQANPKSAKELLISWAASDSQEKTPGKRMKFYEFLSQPINGSRRDAINQYWVTFADVARHRMAIEQTQWLKSVSKPRQQSEQAILAAAQQAAQNRVLHSEIQLAKSQSLLSDYLPNLRRNGKLVAVIPANIPWVGKLNTKFEEYQRRGMVPARFGTIDEYLPKARKLIANEAEAVIASQKAADQARSAMKSGQTSVANVLEASRMKERNEEEFLGAVLGYNRAITDYVLSVRQDIYQPKRLASVLIGRKSVEPTPATAAKPTKSSETQSDVSQLDGRSQVEGPAEDDDRNNAFSENGSRSARQQPTRVASNQPIEYGPTAESAKAANFDPNQVDEELPMQQIKPKSNSDSYGSNEQSAPGSRRTASNAASARTRQPFRGQPAAQPAVASSFPSSTGQGAASSAPSISTPPRTTAAAFNAGASSTSPAGSFAGAASTPTTGGGAFGGASTPTVPATASGLGTSGFSTRR